MKIEDAIRIERERGGDIVAWSPSRYSSNQIKIGGDWWEPTTPPKPREWRYCETHEAIEGRHGFAFSECHCKVVTVVEKEPK